MTKVSWFLVSKGDTILSLIDKLRPRGRALVQFLIPIALLHGILSALRWPMLWATSHMVFDYHFGLGKRGLVGSILGLIAPPPYHYLTLAKIDFVVFAIWLVLLAALSWRGVRRDTGMAAAMVFAFLSAGFAVLVGDMGYFEHFGLVLSLTCLLLPSGLIWAPLRAALMLMAVFTHEGNFLMFVPVVLFDVMVSRSKIFDWRSLAAAAITGVPAAAATYYLGNVRLACDHAVAMRYFQSKVRDFAVRDDTVDTLCRDGAFNWRLVSLVWHGSAQYFFLTMALVVVLPSTVFNIALITRIAGRKVIIGLIAAGSVFSPLVLNLLGADLVRFTSLVQITSLLALLAIARRRGLAPGGSLPSFLRGPVPLCALGCFELASSLVLTDTSAMMKFPFVPILARLFFVLHGDQKFVVIPPL